MQIAARNRQALKYLMKTNKTNPARGHETPCKPDAVKGDKLAANVEKTLDQLRKDLNAGDRKAEEFQKLLNAFRRD